jgi:hypothetical protein
LEDNIATKFGTRNLKITSKCKTQRNAIKLPEEAADHRTYSQGVLQVHQDICGIADAESELAATVHAV